MLSLQPRFFAFFRFFLFIACLPLVRNGRFCFAALRSACFIESNTSRFTHNI